jgi:hypothetical protein
MFAMTDRAKAQIRAILLADWDPIAIKEILDPSRVADSDEYDLYIQPIMDLLSAAHSKDEIADYLYRTEVRGMGSRRGRATAEAAAEKLMHVDLQR